MGTARTVVHASRNVYAPQRTPPGYGVRVRWRRSLLPPDPERPASCARYTSDQDHLCAHYTLFSLESLRPPWFSVIEAVRVAEEQVQITTSRGYGKSAFFFSRPVRGSKQCIYLFFLCFLCSLIPLNFDLYHLLTRLCSLLYTQRAIALIYEPKMLKIHFLGLN